LYFPENATTRTSARAASEVIYDAVVVGSGVAGSIIASELSAAGMRVLVLEAGVGEDRTLEGYEKYVSKFYATAAKDNQAPYPPNPNADMPRGEDVRRIYPGQPDTSAYVVKNGPLATDTTYTRVFGGTTMHWEAKTPRMLPSDFRMRSRFGHGRDWPISYADLQPFYERAERELGVSGEVADQAELGVPFPDGYQFPMRGIPLSYLDKTVAASIDGLPVDMDGEKFQLKVRSFAQARNGVPNPHYDGGRGFTPVGAVSTSQVEEGGRCQGNINCVPICPVQAKYSAGRTLAKALQTGRVDVLVQAVASKVLLDPKSGQVSGIEIKRYADPGSPRHTTHTMRGRVFVLAAGAVENPRLMLASGVGNSSGLVGRNFMDHAYLLTWGLLPQIAGTYRGTVCTAGISDLRDGAFRQKQAAFAVDIHNDGWGWPVGSPYSDLVQMVDSENLFGAALRDALPGRLSRQLLMAFMVDVPASESNRVSVEPALVDPLGNMRPVISYTLSEYTMRGVAAGRRLSQRLFQRLGAADHTRYDPSDPQYTTYEGEGFVVRGGNHLAGTHVMGSSRTDSVVDADQRSWDHENLYLVGGGSMASVGTSNVTLTLAAMCLRTADRIVTQFRGRGLPSAAEPVPARTP
jgi:choline dehydrogenase-like flavoprotein